MNKLVEHEASFDSIRIKRYIFICQVFYDDIPNEHVKVQKKHMVA